MSNSKCQTANKKTHLLEIRSIRQAQISYWKFVIGYFESGFSLIEMLIYMGLFSILMGILINVLFSILDISKESEAISSVDKTSRYLLSRFTYDIQRAQAVTTPAILGQQSNTMVLQISSANYTYNLDTNGNLQLNNGQNIDNLNSYDASISGLLFQNIGASSGKNTIRISFTVASRTKQRSGFEVRNYQTTIGLR